MGGWDWVVLLAVATAAIASTQTTILPASRTGLSMARRHALPAAVRAHPPEPPHPRRLHVVGRRHRHRLVRPGHLVSENALFDSITALSLLIAFYYALTGIACAIYYRRQLTRSASSSCSIGVGPVIGSLLLIWLLVLSIRDLADPENSYTGRPGSVSGPRGDRPRDLPARRDHHVRVAGEGRAVLAGEAERGPGAVVDRGVKRTEAPIQRVERGLSALCPASSAAAGPHGRLVCRAGSPPASRSAARS